MVSSWHMRCVTYSDVLAGCQVVAMQLLMCSEYVVSMALQVVETKVKKWLTCFIPTHFT